VPSNLKRHLFGLFLGLSAALFGLTPVASVLEEMSGLDFLFWLRGAIQPPAEVVTIGIDRNSSLTLGAGDDPARWPRSLHAQAVRRLHAAGADLIAFDIVFGDAHPEEDKELAAAIREAGNVVLADFLKLRHLQGDVYAESLEQPVSELADSAVASAPFLLVQGAKANRFLTLHGEQGERPTLPMILLQLRLAMAGGKALLSAVAADGEGSAGHGGTVPLDRLTKTLLEQPELLRREGTDTQAVHQLQALAESYAGNPIRYFNHYGPAGTITRIPYHQLVEGDVDPDLASKLHGKVVLVGFTENFQPNTTEGIYYSPFSPVSSLELAATAVANLLENRQVRPFFDDQKQFLWLLFWGYLLGLLSQSRAVSTGSLQIIFAATAYLVLAAMLFKSRGLWIPISIPLFWEMPVALLACLVGNYMTRAREHRKIHSVIRRFIPVDVASQLIHPESHVHWDGRLTFGVCLATDAGQYTALAESMPPMALGELMNRYYACVFPAVTGNQGWVSDVVGDAMMAIWTGEDGNLDLRRRALSAALEILQALSAFEQDNGIVLPIRMGLHCGEMRVGFVGASDHGEYRAVGDTVNTAARLEALNKLLGTHILLAEGLTQGIDGFLIRRLGSFLLAGKVQPVSVVELLCQKQEAPEHLPLMIDRFEQALELYQRGEWSDALAKFALLAIEYPEDGPTRFYRDAAAARISDPEGGPPGSAIVTSKTAPAHPV